MLPGQGRLCDLLCLAAWQSQSLTLGRTPVWTGIACPMHPAKRINDALLFLQRVAKYSAQPGELLA